MKKLKERDLTFLREAIAEAQAHVDLLQRTYALLAPAETNGHRDARADVLAQALTLDAARRAKTKPGPKPKPKPKAPRATTKARDRARSADVLALFEGAPSLTPDVVRAKGVDDLRRLAPLVHHGYLKRGRGGSFVRTTKVFTP